MTLSPAVQRRAGEPDERRVRQWLDHGTIRGLEVHDGEPMFGPKTEVLHDLKLDGDEAPRPERDMRDFVVPREIRRLVFDAGGFAQRHYRTHRSRTGVPRRIIFKAAEAAPR